MKILSINPGSKKQFRIREADDSHVSLTVMVQNVRAMNEKTEMAPDFSQDVGISFADYAGKVMRLDKVDFYNNGELLWNESYSKADMSLGNPDYHLNALPLLRVSVSEDMRDILLICWGDVIAAPDTASIIVRNLETEKDITRYICGQSPFYTEKFEGYRAKLEIAKRADIRDSVSYLEAQVDALTRAVLSGMSEDTEARRVLEAADKYNIMEIKSETRLVAEMKHKANIRNLQSSYYAGIVKVEAVAARERDLRADPEYEAKSEAEEAVSDLQKIAAAGVRENLSGIVSDTEAQYAGRLSEVSDAAALKMPDYFPTWDGDGHQYVIGDRVVYNDVLYKVLQAHTSQSDWTPDAAPSLFAKVLTSTTGEPLPWEQPDSTNPYMIGDRVTYNGKVYESTQDNNIWAPDAYPQGWKEIEG